MEGFQAKVPIFESTISWNRKMEGGAIVLVAVMLVAFGSIMTTTTAEDLSNLCEFEARFHGATDSCFSEEELKLKEGHCSSKETTTNANQRTDDPKVTTPEEDVTTDLPASTDYITGCPNNMIYGNCTCGQRHCTNPTLCQDTCAGDLTEGCLCPDGFYMQEGNCVPDDQCGCYFPEEQHIVPENTTHVNNACTSIVACSNGELIKNDTYQCSPDAVCEEREGVRKCYYNFGYAGDGATCDLGIDCQAAYDVGYTESGVYPIKPTNWPGTAFDVYCNMTTDGKGWTVFQRRINGTVDFNIYWRHYEEGFGTIGHEYWLGNRKLHYLTSQRSYRLRVDIVLKNGSPKYAEYDSFEINDASDNYRLSSLGAFSGDSALLFGFTYNRNKQFTTRDRDNDDNGFNCAIYANHYRGGWWYHSCTEVNLNGNYGAGDCSIQSIMWNHQDCSLCNLKYTEMKIGPI